MAKSRKSRRVRRQEMQKQRQSSSAEIAQVTSEAVIEEDVPAPTDDEEQDMNSSPLHKTTIDYAWEYFYVYSEMRMILISAILMFGVLVGLSFLI